MAYELLDYFQLADLSLVRSDLNVTKSPKSPAKLLARIQVTQAHGMSEKNPGNPDAPIQLIDSTLSVEMKVFESAADERGLCYAASATIKAQFVSVSKERAVERAEIEAGNGGLSRVLYPVARFEISRLLSGARISDPRAAWDLGVERSQELSDKAIAREATTGEKKRALRRASKKSRKV